MKLLAKISLPSSFTCKPSSNKFSTQMWKLLSINRNPFNLQTHLRMLFTAINLSLNIFCGLHIYDETKTSFTLLFLHFQPILTIHSTISFFVSCLLPISLQPMCSIKTSGVSSFKIGFTYVSICFRVVLGVAPIAFIQFWIKFFSSNSFNHTGS